MDFEFEGILQRGQARRTAAATDVNDRDVRAYYLYGELGYRLDNAVGPRFAVSATYGSGQNDSDNITRFDQLFGAIFPDYAPPGLYGPTTRSEEHTSELQSLMRISYAVFCLKKQQKHRYNKIQTQNTYIQSRNKI